MPRCFFHLRDARTCGTELSDDNAARSEAVVFSGETLLDLGGKFWTSDEWLVEVVREDGKQICQLTLSARDIW